MDIWPITRTILMKNPRGIKAKDLVGQIQKRTRSGRTHKGLSRTTIYAHFASFELKEMLYRDDGIYWLKKTWAQSLEEIALRHFRYRADVDGVRYYRYLTRNPDKIVKKGEPKTP